MESALQQYTADHRYLLDLARRCAGLADPVAVHLADFQEPLLKKAWRGPLVPVDGALVRDWDPDARRFGIRIGLRLYEIDGVRFVLAHCAYHNDLDADGLTFFVVDRRDYRRLYRSAQRCRREQEPAGQPPVLPAEQAETLWKNTIAYLEPRNLRRIKAYGGRARRGILLLGPPGNGKTMACRWIWEECRRRRWEWRLVTPDSYRAARDGCNPQEQVRALFTLEKRGMIFFDDMDIALRDRETVKETDDQAVFLGALDGLRVNEGVVFLFTSNCAPELIDRAFKRPGRLDLVLHFQAPDSALRRQLIERWHPEIRSSLRLETAVASTDGYSFAEIEELKNLLILRYLEADVWDWSWALRQFEVNRRDLGQCDRARVGFLPPEPVPANGRH